MSTIETKPRHVLPSLPDLPNALTIPAGHRCRIFVDTDAAKENRDRLKDQRWGVYVLEVTNEDGGIYWVMCHAVEMLGPSTLMYGLKEGPDERSAWLECVEGVVCLFKEGQCIEGLSYGKPLSSLSIRGC